MIRAALIYGVLASARIAAADGHDATFAKNFGVAATAVHDVVGYELPAGNETTHVLTGRFDHGTYVMAGAVLLKCDATQCQGRRADFGAADAIALHGVVDLYGDTPGPLPSRVVPASGHYTKVPGARGMKFPALVVRTLESKQRAKLYVISLVETDRASTVLQDTAADQGMTRTYRLDTGDTKGALDIIATERRRDGRCPEPTEQRFTLEERHYRTKSYTPARGC